MIWLLNNVLNLDGGEVVRWWLQAGSAWPIWAILAGAIAIALASWWAYRAAPSGALEPPRPGMPPDRGLPARKRWTMAALRLAALLLVACILLEPQLCYDRTVGEKPRLIVLMDDTQSMTIRDRRVKPDDRLAAARAMGQVKYGGKAGGDAIGDTGDPSRSALLSALWRNKDLDLHARLARHYDLRFFRFGQETHELISRSPPEVVSELRFDGPVTDVGQAIRRAIQELRGRPAAGVVVMTDGQSNRGEAPVEAARAAAAERLPLFTVGIGAAEARDLAIASFLSEDVVFVSDDVTVYGIIRQRGYAGETVSVELHRESELIAREQVRLTDETEQPFKLRFKPKGKGESNYRLSVEQRPDELITDNNWKDKRIRVIDEAIRVLAVEQAPRWDFRFLKGSLLRDKRVQLRVFVREADGAELAAGAMPEYMARFPDKREDLFKFDVIILGDVPSDAFSKEQLKLLEEFVAANGGGLCFAAGPRYNPSTYKNTALEPLIPVVFEAQPEPTPEMELFAPLVQPYHLEITREGLASPVCTLADSDAANASLWRRLPPFYWHFPAMRLRPGATALAVHAEVRSRDGRVPMIAHEYYGKGVTFYLGFDSTWRWRDRVGSKYFARFWGQMINFLSMAHLLGESKRVQITLDSRTCSIGDTVHISARVLDKTYQPLAAPEVTARVGLPDQEPVEVPLQAIPTQPGMFTGQCLATATGEYTVSVKGEEADGKVTFRVQTPQLEFDRPAMEDASLRAVAGETGGRYFGLADLDALPDAIARSRPVRTIPDRTPLWDTWLMLVAAVTLLGSEWLIRKRSDLA